MAVSELNEVMKSEIVEKMETVEKEITELRTIDPFGPDKQLVLKQDVIAEMTNILAKGRKRGAS